MVSGTNYWGRPVNSIKWGWLNPKSIIHCWFILNTYREEPCLCILTLFPEFSFLPPPFYIPPVRAFHLNTIMNPNLRLNETLKS